MRHRLSQHGYCVNYIAHMSCYQSQLRSLNDLWLQSRPCPMVANCLGFGANSPRFLTISVLSMTQALSFSLSFAAKIYVVINLWTQVGNIYGKNVYRKAKKSKAKTSTISSANKIDNESDTLCPPNLPVANESNVECVSDSIIISPLDKTNCLSIRMGKPESVNLDVPFLEQFHHDNYEDSLVAARELFKLLISPLEVDQFYA